MSCVCLGVWCVWHVFVDSTPLHRCLLSEARGQAALYIEISWRALCLETVSQAMLSTAASAVLYLRSSSSVELGLANWLDGSACVILPFSIGCRVQQQRFMSLLRQM